MALWTHPIVGGGDAPTLPRCSIGVRTWISSFLIAGQRTAPAVADKGRRAWIRMPGLRSPRETWAGPPPASPRAGR
jgi:hypothetical protein